MQCAVHLINRMPLVVLKGKSPYEVLFGTKPNYTHLNVFGYLCFASTLKRERHKFMLRAQESIFLGYSSNKIGYKIYNLETKGIIVTKDVIFHENFFPFQYLKNKKGSHKIKQIFLPAYSKEYAFSEEPFLSPDGLPNNNIKTKCVPTLKIKITFLHLLILQKRTLKTT